MNTSTNGEHNTDPASNQTFSHDTTGIIRLDGIVTNCKYVCQIYMPLVTCM